MNNYNITSVPFLQNEKSSLEKPKIILLDLNIDFDKITNLISKTNLSLTNENFMSDIFNFLRNENLIKDIDNNLYSVITDEDELFSSELDMFFKAYKEIVLDLYKILKDFKLYNNGSLVYQFGCVFNDTTLILYQPSLNDII